jgi:hypothetical protein
MARRPPNPPGGPEPEAAEDDVFGPPAARAYALLSLGALLVLALLLSQGRLGWWNLLPALAGVVAVLLRWVIGPPLVLVTLLVLLLAQNRVARGAGAAASPLADLPLACAALTYVAAHSRLLFLRRRAAAADAPKGPPPGGSRRGVLLPPAQGGRSPEAADAAEVGPLLLMVPLFATTGLLVWLRLAVETPYPRLYSESGLGHALLLVWLVGGGLASMASVMAYLGWAQATPEEALQYLQDQLWRETRGEQRRLNRWLVWARLRGQRRKEGA